MIDVCLLTFVALLAKPHNKMNVRKILGAHALVGTLVFSVASCNKDDKNSIPTYEVPATYTFDNVNYAEATGSVNMWAGLSSYLGKSTSRQLSADTAAFLWANTNNAFTAEIASNLPLTVAAINALGFGNSGKAADAATFKMYIDSMVNISQYFGDAATNGLPGKVSNRLVNYAGLEFNQLVAKGLMGALQLSKVFSNLDATLTADNNTVVTGQGTAMQHNWDLAFGYVGIPTDYDTAATYANTDPKRPLAIGGYFKERGRYIKSGGLVFEAFRTGRAAIGAKDYATRNLAIAVIKATMEKTLAAAAYAYATLPQGSSDLAVQFHAYSECAGFIAALKYRDMSVSPLTSANYAMLLSLIQTNFYVLAADATNAKLKQIQSILNTTYGQLQ